MGFRYEMPLVGGRLLRRYKRFLADVVLDDGREVVAHCPNSGSMRGCAEPGWRVMLSPAANPKRKLKWTWELVHNGDCWIGVNTQRPNQIVYLALMNNEIPALSGLVNHRREVRYGVNSRIDVYAESADGQACWIEVKNVTMLADDGCLAFPDAVTERGRKHLGELMDRVAAGDRAVMLFLCQRSDGNVFRAAHEIDPKYAQTLQAAAAAGVEILPLATSITAEGVCVGRTLAVQG